MPEFTHQLTATNCPLETEQTAIKPLTIHITALSTGLDIRFAGTHHPQRGSVFIELGPDGQQPQVFIHDRRGPQGGVEGDPVAHIQLQLEDDTPDA